MIHGRSEDLGSPPCLPPACDEPEVLTVLLARVANLAGAATLRRTTGRAMDAAAVLENDMLWLVYVGERYKQKERRLFSTGFLSLLDDA